MRLIFVGTAQFAVPILEAVMAADHTVAAVVTQPDRPADQDRTLRPGPIRRAAIERDLPVFQPHRIGSDSSLDNLRALAPDAMLVVAYGQILPPTVLDVPRLGCYNVHASVLPALRGPAPINWAVIRGLKRTGVTIIRVSAGVDTGQIAARRDTEIGPRETAGELSARLSRIGADLTIETLPLIETGALELVPQDESEATPAPKLTKADGAIDWARPAAELDCLIRGVTPWPGAFAALQRRAKPRQPVRVIVHRARPADGAGDPGRVIDLGEDHFTVAARQGALALESIQPAGKRVMSAADFINGYRLAVGDRFLPGKDVLP